MISLFGQECLLNIKNQSLLSIIAVKRIKDNIRCGQIIFPIGPDLLKKYSTYRKSMRNLRNYK